MNTRNKNILKAGWELVVALFVFIGTFFGTLIKAFLSEPPKTDEDKDNFILHNSSTMISYNRKSPKIISIDSDT